MTLISIVVPAYNEEATIERVLSLLIEKVHHPLEVIVVDDGSTDRTADIVETFGCKHPGVRCIRQTKNAGKTAALRTGFSQSTGEIVLVQDADLEYDPGDIPNLVEPIVSHKADVVYGSRFMVKRAARVLYFRHYMANRFLTLLLDLLTDMNFTDVETGYKAFRGEIIRNMIIDAKGFGFEIEVTAKIKKLKCRVYEVPISYYGRTYEEGKKIGVRDGLMAVYYIFKYSFFSPLKNRLPECLTFRVRKRSSGNILHGFPLALSPIAVRATRFTVSNNCSHAPRRANCSRNNCVHQRCSSFVSTSRIQAAVSIIGKPGQA